MLTTMETYPVLN